MTPRRRPRPAEIAPVRVVRVESDSARDRLDGISRILARLLDDDYPLTDEGAQPLASPPRRD